MGLITSLLAEFNDPASNNGPVILFHNNAIKRTWEELPTLKSKNAQYQQVINILLSFTVFLIPEP